MLKGTDISMLGKIPKHVLKGCFRVQQRKIAVGSMGISLPLRSVSN